MPFKNNHFGKLLGGAILIVFLYISFGGEYNLYLLWKLHNKKQMLLEQIKQNQFENAHLLDKIEKLKYDFDYIEKVAREKYKMGKPGEQIYLTKNRNIN